MLLSDAAVWWGFLLLFFFFQGRSQSTECCRLCQGRLHYIRLMLIVCFLAAYGDHTVSNWFAFCGFAHDIRPVDFVFLLC